MCRKITPLKYRFQRTPPRVWVCECVFIAPYRVMGKAEHTTPDTGQISSTAVLLVTHTHNLEDECHTEEVGGIVRGHRVNKQGAWGQAL